MSSKLSVGDSSIVIVISEFNQLIVENLLQGALDAFVHHGGKESDIRIHRVPGAFEIPGTIRQIIKFNNPDAIIALGAVIRGETPGLRPRHSPRPGERWAVGNGGRVRCAG